MTPSQRSTGFTILVMLLLSFALAACQSDTAADHEHEEEHVDAHGEDEGDHHEEISTKSIVGDAVVQAEVNKLISSLAAQTTTEADFATIVELSKGDAFAEHELEEIEMMVRYGEFKHAGHGMSFLDSYVQTGNNLLCPGHELAHYYVFSRHGETEKAQHALEEAQEQLAGWKELGTKYSEQYPGPEPFGQTVNNVEEHLAAAKTGTTTANEQDIDYLANALCVESP